MPVERWQNPRTAKDPHGLRQTVSAGKVHGGVGVAWRVFAIWGGKRAGKQIPARAAIADHRGSDVVAVWGVAILG